MSAIGNEPILAKWRSSGRPDIGASAMRYDLPTNFAM